MNHRDRLDAYLTAMMAYAGTDAVDVAGNAAALWTKDGAEWGKYDSLDGAAELTGNVCLQGR